MRYNMYYFDNYGLPQVKISTEDFASAFAIFRKHVTKNIVLTAEFDTKDAHNMIYTECI